MKNKLTYLLPLMKKWRRDLHQIPEVGIFTPNTQDYICAVLDEYGIPYKKYETCTGISAVIEGRKEKNPDDIDVTVALRSDMDGLPTEEETNLYFASKNGNMHSCGHDGHMASLLAATVYLWVHKELFSGKIKIIFQPGEEGHGGAIKMVNEGVNEDPKVDLVFGLHLAPSIPTITGGVFALSPGVIMAGGDAFKLTIGGKGGHIGNIKSDGLINPIFAGAHILAAIEEKNQKLELEADSPFVFNVGCFKGGTKENIIPDSVEIRGSFRTFNQDLRDNIMSFIDKDCRTIANHLGVTYQLEIINTNLPVNNDKETTEKLGNALGAIIGDEQIKPLPEPLIINEDIPRLFAGRKGVFIHLGCGKKGEFAKYPLHNNKFDFDENAMALAALYFVTAALTFSK